MILSEPGSLPAWAMEIAIFHGTLEPWPSLILKTYTGLRTGLLQLKAI